MTDLVKPSPDAGVALHPDLIGMLRWRCLLDGMQVSVSEASQALAVAVTAGPGGTGGYLAERAVWTWQRRDSELLLLDRMRSGHQVGDRERRLAGQVLDLTHRVDLRQLPPGERATVEAEMRDPQWAGSARIETDWSRVWWNVGVGVALLVFGLLGLAFLNVPGLVLVAGIYVALHVAAAQRNTLRGNSFHALAAWPLCLPEEGAGPWLAMVGLAVVAWLAGTAYTHIRQPRPRRPVRPVPRREGVTR